MKITEISASKRMAIASQIKSIFDELHTIKYGMGDVYTLMKKFRFPKTTIIERIRPLLKINYIKDYPAIGQKLGRPTTFFYANRDISDLLDNELIILHLLSKLPKKKENIQRYMVMKEDECNNLLQSMTEKGYISKILGGKYADSYCISCDIELYDIYL